MDTYKCETNGNYPQSDQTRSITLVAELKTYLSCLLKPLYSTHYAISIIENQYAAYTMATSTLASSHVTTFSNPTHHLHHSHTLWCYNSSLDNNFAHMVLCLSYQTPYYETPLDNPTSSAPYAILEYICHWVTYPSLIFQTPLYRYMLMSPPLYYAKNPDSSSYLHRIVMLKTWYSLMQNILAIFTCKYYVINLGQCF